MPSKHEIKALLSEYYPLIAILIGAVLISLPMGPYQNTDTQVEFSTAKGVLRWGYPYLEVKGNLFDLPPLGFYIEALFFLVVGSSMKNGIALITLFGLGCTLMVYELGKEVYSRTTGVFAAALFAFSPWELVLTRAFLVDTQCLFLNLVCLYFGILAIRRDSVKLALVSGIFFAAALLTKQYAAFMLIPLLLLYSHHRPRNLKKVLFQLTAFIMPAVHATLWWYNIIMGKWLLYFIQHKDFADLNFPGVIPSYSFITTFLIDYGLGVLFVVAFVFSLTIGLLSWKRFAKRSLIFDFVCLSTILFILGLNTYLGVTLNLKAPYTSAIKYSYQALPFFSFVAASLATKSASLLKSASNCDRLKKTLLFSMGFISLFLLVAPIIVNITAARQLTTVTHVIYRVQLGQNLGYTFLVPSPTSQNNVAAAFIQLHGAVIVLSGLLWASRHFVMNYAKPMIYRFQKKNAPGN